MNDKRGTLDDKGTSGPKHIEQTVAIAASAEEVFAYIDDHARFSAHMSRSSWMMAGSRMHTEIDAGGGQRVGSHIRMDVRFLGIRLSLDEVVTRHEPPHAKAWRTVGTPRLLVIGNYQMDVEVTREDGRSLLRVSIDYSLPTDNAWLGRLFGAMYARWCIRQMVDGARKEFDSPRPVTREM